MRPSSEGPPTALRTWDMPNARCNLNASLCEHVVTLALVEPLLFGRHELAPLIRVDKPTGSLRVVGRKTVDARFLIAQPAHRRRIRDFTHSSHLTIPSWSKYASRRLDGFPRCRAQRIATLPFSGRSALTQPHDLRFQRVIPPTRPDSAPGSACVRSRTST